ncbi:MAG TPA: Uma2 family endonuclease [Blastocatellia bacterium]
MSSQTKPTTYTPEEYLALERSSGQRSEYFNGEIFAMGGASENHNLIVINVAASLHAQMRGKACKVYSSDMRVRIQQTGLYAYPDVVALCGAAQFDDEYQDILINPAVIIEVLSKSTERYDRWENFAQYRRIESLAQYVLISQNRNRIESYRRQPHNQWLMSEVSEPHETLELPPIQCTLLIAEVHDKVFPSTI